MNTKNFAILALVMALNAGMACIAHASSAKNGDSSTMRNIIPDASITASIKSEYLADSGIRSLSIHVETVNGVVTLTGDVSNEEMRTRAESIAEHTEGVKRVVSKLKVK